MSYLPSESSPLRDELMESEAVRVDEIRNRVPLPSECQISQGIMNEQLLREILNLRSEVKSRHTAQSANEVI